MRNGSLILVEGDRVDDPFELPARVEARHHIRDLVGAHGLSGLGAFRSGAEPEAAEIAQLDDVPLGQLAGDDGQEAFDCGDHVHRAQGGHLGSQLGKLAGRHAPAGLDGRVELLGGSRVGRVPPLDDVKFDAHGISLSFLIFTPGRQRFSFRGFSTFSRGNENVPGGVTRHAKSDRIIGCVTSFGGLATIPCEAYRIELSVSFGGVRSRTLRRHLSVTLLLS